ncbi:MAG: hypothetical protein DRP42_00420 [Tenericutes bacterium]|nr:MAG: hypothetical protein DRP42_00420 [Mycoplasmatota bacterium]
MMKVMILQENAKYNLGGFYNLTNYEASVLISSGIAKEHTGGFSIEEQIIRQRFLNNKDKNKSTALTSKRTRYSFILIVFSLILRISLPFISVSYGLLGASTGNNAQLITSLVVWLVFVLSSIFLFIIIYSYKVTDKKSRLTITILSFILLMFIPYYFYKKSHDMDTNRRKAE